MPTTIVTGANAGLGYEITRGLRHAGFHVIMACRNADKALTAKARLEQEPADGTLEFCPLDLEHVASIEAFVQTIKERGVTVDLLVNNAAILDYAQSRNVNGHDLMFAVNHLGHFRLTAGLLPCMPDTVDSRIVTVASLAHRRGHLDMDKLRAGELHPSRQAYGDSKLANLVFATELDRRLRAAGRNMLSVAAHPGVSPTELFEDVPLYYRLALRILGPFLTHSPESAARSILHACLDPSVKSGDYIGPQGPFGMRGTPGLSKRTPLSMYKSLGRELWQVSEEMCGMTFPIDHA